MCKDANSKVVTRPCSESTQLLIPNYWCCVPSCLTILPTSTTAPSLLASRSQTETRSPFLRRLATTPVTFKDKLMLESILSVFNYQPAPALPSDLQAPDRAEQARLSPDPGLSLSSRPTWSRIRSWDRRWRDKMYDYLPPAQLAGSSQSGLTPCYNSDKLKRCSLRVTWRNIA